MKNIWYLDEKYFGPLVHLGVGVTVAPDRGLDGLLDNVRHLVHHKLGFFCRMISHFKTIILTFFVATMALKLNMIKMLKESQKRTKLYCNTKLILNMFEI